jgi:RNA-directed DNA polymerase
MARTFPGVPWCRYADDGLVHCKTEAEALFIKAALKDRFAECGLEMHPDKTQVVYCRDGSRKGKYPNKEFDFLGYTFRPRVVKNRKRNSLFVSFSPAVSSKALKSMRQRTRRLNFRNRTELSLRDISRLYNPILRGWIAYYGRYYPSAMYPLYRHINNTLVAWAMRKYRRLKRHKTRASLFLESVAEAQPYLFVHWQKGTVGSFA